MDDETGAWYRLWSIVYGRSSIVGANWKIANAPNMKGGERLLAVVIEDLEYHWTSQMALRGCPQHPKTGESPKELKS
ncbi:MAG: hypothetical protein ACJ8CR_10640 [Roseiflexaceae bacterium]